MHEDEGINDKELEDTIDVDVGMENEFAQEEKVGDPEIGMVFDTAEGLFEYYTKYGSENGFPIKKRSSSKGDDGVVRWVLLHVLDRKATEHFKKCFQIASSLQNPIQPTTCGSEQPTACETSGNVHTTTKDNGLICSPQSVRGAGRPPFKRNTSKLEQAVKKLQEKKKKEGKREQVVKMNQGKKKGMSTIENTMNDLDLEKVCKQPY
ncbi:hypothetical protein IFM89_029742 [Coptis chinensis]|uniref:Protein FAR1-RELATED SEQUENCE n=1 Tax=Coptis chinensis TaxID=261450 RepID=A0A835M228_9MAGN|nr:hypothetical protein IFM89_029742 [Coptis chinensis]